jgi:hypothetical protein
MTTNQNRHALRNLRNRIIAVIDDPRHTQAAIETLEQAGIGDADLATFSGDEGARQIDAEGVHSAGMTHVLRALQRWTVEGAHLRQYEAELAQGHQVVDVHIHGRRRQDAVVRILRAHGAHFINAYGQWTIEGVAA